MQEVPAALKESGHTKPSISNTKLSVMKTLEFPVRSLLQAVALTAITLSFASLAGADSVRVQPPAANEGPAPARVTVTPPQAGNQRPLERKMALRAHKIAAINRMAQEASASAQPIDPHALAAADPVTTTTVQDGETSRTTTTLTDPVSGK